MMICSSDRAPQFPRMLSKGVLIRHETYKKAQLLSMQEFIWVLREGGGKGSYFKSTFQKAPQVCFFMGSIKPDNKHVKIILLSGI